MPEYSFGGTSMTETFYPPVRSSGIPLPEPRLASDGRRYAVITHLSAALTSITANRKARILFAGAATDWFAPSINAPQYRTEPVLVPIVITDPGAAEFAIDADGRISYGRREGGDGTISDADGNVRAGTLGGSVTYLLPPNAPVITSVEAAGWSAIVQVDEGAYNDSGASILGFSVVQATDEAFTQNVRTVTVNTDGLAVFTDCEPDATYFYRASAQNEATAFLQLAGGAPSAVATNTFPPPAGGLGVIYVGGEERPLAGQIFTGENWADADGVIFDGTNWMPIGI